MAVKKSPEFYLNANQWLMAMDMYGTKAEFDEYLHILEIPADMAKKFKRYFKRMNKRIREGWTPVDFGTSIAMQRAIEGYETIETKVHFDGGEHGSGKWETLNITKRYAPDAALIKMAKTNRQRDKWVLTSHTTVSTPQDESLMIGVRDETKTELVNSILALIKPKSDNPDDDE